MRKEENGVEVRFENGDLWLTQKVISILYNVDRTVITKHIKNIYDELELEENSTIRNFRIVQQEGNREVETNYYNFYEIY